MRTKTIAIIFVLNVYEMNCLKLFASIYCLLFIYSASAQDKTLQSVAPFPVGCAIDPVLLTNNNNYRMVVFSEYNSITSENVLKFARTHPQKEVYDFKMGDVLVDYAVAHKKRIHGHCLAWHQSVPKWLSEFQGDSAAWEGLLKTHIKTVLQHYKGKMSSWDVVNEAFEDNGKYRHDSVNIGHRHNTLWLNHLGADYIARAFIYAHNADPKALLFYNDFGQEYSEAKVSAIIRMVDDFKKRGIPINGLGLQMHISVATKNEGISNAIKRLASTGLLIHIAELDVKVNPKKEAVLVYSDSLKIVQSNKYAFVVKQYKTLVPVGQQYGITCWNVGDADSWIPKENKAVDWPLPFDDNYRKKDCYTAFLNALKE